MMQRVLKIKAILGPLAWGAAVMFLISRVGDLLYLVTKAFLGRFLSPIDFGAIEPINSALAILALPVSIGFALATKSISRLEALGKEREKRALIYDMVLFSCLGSFIVGLGIWIFRGLILARLSLVSPIYGVIIVFLVVMAWWVPLCLSIIRGKRKFGMLSLPQIVAPITVLGLSILFVGHWQLGLPGALFAQLGGGGLWVLMFLWLERRDLVGDRVRCREEYRDIYRGLFPMGIFLTSLILLMHFDRLFVRNFITAESGGYGAVITLGCIPGLLIVPLAFVSFPLAAAAHATGRDVQKFMTHSLVIGLSVTTVCALGFAIAGETILDFWRSEFMAYGKYVWVYALVTGLQGVIGAIGNVELARNKTGFLWGVSIPTLLMCGLMYVFRGSMSVERVLLAMICTHTCILVWVLLAMRRSSREDPPLGQ